MYPYVFLLLSIWTAIALGLNCNAVTGDHAFCACTMDDESGTVDISSYANTDNTPRFTGTSGQFTYDYNPCYPMNANGYSSCSDNTAAGCQLANPPSGYNIGKFDQAKFSVDSDSNVVISYAGGDGDRNMKVTLKCNRDLKDIKFTADGEKVTKQYSFTLESKCSCAYKDGDSCGGGGGGNNPERNDSPKKSKKDPGVVGIIILCLAFVAFISYFVIGAIVLRVRYQKSGTDLIINKEFWKDFPILVKDGIVFTFSPCYKLIKDRIGGGGGYSNI